ncbi:hypothetical protein [Nostoc linckia]|uniref:hypothetical protein n=1 Tax=Nostoc linckia TaxID=92942 RepID=UPI00118139EF|nr:hypothetical protein [Nostoc linckia]
MGRWEAGESCCTSFFSSASCAQCTMPNAQCPMPKKNCAAIRSKGQSHINHDLDKLDSVSLQ